LDFQTQKRIKRWKPKNNNNKFKKFKNNAKENE
jgi:hypothetical protein